MNLLVDHPALLAFPIVALIAVIARLTRGTKPRVRSCIRCGCTDLNACPGGCGWARLDPNVCTTCDLDDEQLADQVFRTAA